MTCGNGSWPAPAALQKPSKPPRDVGIHGLPRPVSRLFEEVAPVGTRHRHCLRLLTAARRCGFDTPGVLWLGEMFCARCGFDREEMRAMASWAERVGNG